MLFQSIFELYNKSIHRSTPVSNGHAPFFTGLFDGKVHHFLAESSLGNTLHFFKARLMTPFNDSIAFVV